MQFMVIERVREENVRRVGERFARQGRMMPQNVRYVASWLVPSGAVCYQVMEAPDRESLEPWLNAWRDLVDFEVHEVLTSAEYWARRADGAPNA